MPSISTANNITLCLTVILTVLAIFLYFNKKDSLKISDFELKNDIVYYSLLSLFAIVAIFVRIYKFGQIPGGFNYDEAMSAVDSKAIAEYGTDRLGMKFPVYFQAWERGQMSAFQNYLMSISIKFAGGSLTPLVCRLPMLLMSIAGMVFFVFLAKDALGKKGALFAALLVAVNPWHIVQSRWALDCNMLAHVFIIATYFLYKGQDKKLFLYISSAIYAISMYCYGPSIYTVPIFLLAVYICLFIQKKVTLKEALISAGIYLLISMPYILCIFINMLKLGTIETPLFTIPFFAKTTRAQDMLFFSKTPLQQLVKNGKRVLDILFFQKDDLLFNSVPGFGIAYVFSVPFTIIGLWQIFKNNFKFKEIVLSGFFIGIFCGLITADSTIYRLNIMYYFVLFIQVCGIILVAKKIKFSALITFCIYLFMFILFTSSYFVKYATDIQRYFFWDFGNALNYVETFDADKYYITAESQFKESKDVSEIYTLFYHEIDSAYFRGETNTLNGKEQNPYKDKYIYKNITPEDINPEESAVYLVTSAQKEFFDETLYNFKDFFGVQTNYCVVTKK